MKIYTVYTQKYTGNLTQLAPNEIPAELGADAKNGKVFVREESTPDQKLETAVFVPESFSWLALIFPINLVLAVMQGNWGFLMLLIIYLFTAIAQFHEPGINSLIVAIKLGLFPFLGIWFNDFLRLTLKQRGYEMVGVVSGRNESEAQLRFFEQSGANSANFHA